MGNIIEFPCDGLWLYKLYKETRERMNSNAKFAIDEERWAKAQADIMQITKFVKENDPDATVEFVVLKECPEHCGIVIKTICLDIMDIPAFCEIIKGADNMEIHPRTDGYLGMSFSFNYIAHELKLKS